LLGWRVALGRRDPRFARSVRDPGHQVRPQRGWRCRIHAGRASAATGRRSSRLCQGAAGLLPRRAARPEY